MRISDDGLVEREFSAMGTTASVALSADSGDPEDADRAIEEVRSIFAENEKIFSRFDPSSELSRLNTRLGKHSPVSDKMLKVMDLALGYHRRFPEQFDPRIIEALEAAGYDRDFKLIGDQGSVSSAMPGRIAGELEQDFKLDSDSGSVMLKRRIDLSGIVKGWTVDECAQFLRRRGQADFIVEAGGDMYVSGQAGPEKSWTIDVEGIGERIVLKLKNEGIATSGISRRKWKQGGERRHHLIDPRSPEKFQNELKSVTVIADSATEADVLAKVLFLMGRAGGMAYAAGHSIKCLMLDYKNQIYVSSRIKENMA